LPDPHLAMGDIYDSIDWDWSAAVLSRRGQYAQAEIAYRKALERRLTALTYRFWVGYELLAQGQPGEALTEFK